MQHKPMLAIISLLAFLTACESGFASDHRRAPPLVWEYLDTQSGLASNAVNAIAVFKNQVYIGTNQGLTVYDPATRKIQQLSVQQGLPHNNVLTLYTEPHRLWIGTAKGLARWESQTLQTIAKRPLTRLAVQALAMKESTLYVGTNRGLHLYDPQHHILTEVKHLKDKNIRVLKLVDNGILISTDKNQGSLYEPATRRFENIQVEFNSADSQIMDIGALGDYIWFASDGSGLIGYNIISYQWFSFLDPVQVDAFSNALREDGRLLWYGAFSGLYSYDIIDDCWIFYPEPVMQTHGISCLALDGATLWIGTKDGGVVYADKRLPHLSVKAPARYFSNETAVLTGLAQGPGAVDVRVDYRSLGAPEAWQSEHVRLKRHGPDIHAEVDFSALPENIYEFRVTAGMGSAAPNETRFTLIKELHGVKLIPKPTTLKKGRTLLTGQYADPNINKIVINPGNSEAELNPEQGTFSGEVVLSLENKQIQLSMYNQKKEVNHVYYPIKVKPAPKFKIIPLAATFIPGLSEVPFKLQFDDQLGTVKGWEFRITDQSGRLVRKLRGRDTLPGQISWDGKDAEGRAVPEGRVFYYSFHFRDQDGQEITAAQGLLRSSVTINPLGQRKRQKLPGVFLFMPGKATLVSDPSALLRAVSDSLRQHPDAFLSIEGHTDAQLIQTDQFLTNQQLSEARAKTIARALVRKYSLPQDKLVTIGYGASLPAAENDQEEGRNQNRRVEVFLLE